MCTVESGHSFCTAAAPFRPREKHRLQSCEIILKPTTLTGSTRTRHPMCLKVNGNMSSSSRSGFGYSSSTSPSVAPTAPPPPPTKVSPLKAAIMKQATPRQVTPPRASPPPRQVTPPRASPPPRRVTPPPRRVTPPPRASPLRSAIRGIGSRSPTSPRSVVAEYVTRPTSAELKAGGLEPGNVVRVGADKFMVIQKFFAGNKFLGLKALPRTQQTRTRIPRIRKSPQVPRRLKGDAAGVIRSHKGKRFILVQGPRNLMWKPVAAASRKSKSRSASTKSKSRSASTKSKSRSASTKSKSRSASTKSKSRSASTKRTKSKSRSRSRSEPRDDGLTLPSLQAVPGAVGQQLKSLRSLERMLEELKGVPVSRKKSARPVALDSSCIQYVVKPTCIKKLCSR
jgi:hypothetical protein